MRRQTATRLAGWKGVAAGLGIVMLSAACGSGGGTSGGGSSSATATPSASASTRSAQPSSVLCQDVAALRASLAKVRQITVGKNTADELAADLEEVKANLTTLARDAGDQWSTQIGAVKSALAKLQTAVTGLPSGATSVTAVVNALGEMGTATQNLFAAAASKCPSSSPSAST